MGIRIIVKGVSTECIRELTLARGLLCLTPCVRTRSRLLTCSLDPEGAWPHDIIYYTLHFPVETENAKLVIFMWLCRHNKRVSDCATCWCVQKCNEGLPVWLMDCAGCGPLHSIVALQEVQASLWLYRCGFLLHSCQLPPSPSPCGLSLCGRMCM